MERKRRFQTRQQYAEHKAKETKFDKADKSLNYLIGIVAVLIVATLIFLISRDPAPVEESQQEEQLSEMETNDSPAEEDDRSAEDEPEESMTDEDGETQVDNADEPSAQSENTISPSNDPVVEQVITNANWPAYPTAQTGEHVSTYEKGHIDYEEKLKAIFSVLDLQQENSIVLSVKNNGSAKNAIAVVTSMDKELKYRVSIEWIDNEGWKPIQLEVLTTLEGAY